MLTANSNEFQSAHRAGHSSETALLYVSYDVHFRMADNDRSSFIISAVLKIFIHRER